MKKLLLVLVTAIFSLVSCSAWGGASITFINNCSKNVSAEYSYTEDSNSAPSGNEMFSGNVKVPARGSETESIGASFDTYVTVKVSLGEKTHDYSFFVPLDGEKTITIDPSDF